MASPTSTDAVAYELALARGERLAPRAFAVTSPYAPPASPSPPPSFDWHGAFTVAFIEAEQWAQQYGAQRVAEITAPMRQTMTERIQRAIADGVPVGRLAIQLRDGLGLTEAQMASVWAYREDLEQRGVPEAKVDQLVARYRQNWIRFRATSIARTELLAAANAGQQLLWQKAVDAGYLQTDEWERSWIVTPDDRLCPKCRPYHDARAPINGTYTGGSAGPPLHVRCRCSQGLKRVGTPQNTRQLPEFDDTPGKGLKPAVPRSAGWTT